MDRFIEVDEAVQLTGKSQRTLYRLVTSLKRKEGKELKSVKQETVNGKTRTLISLEVLKQKYGINDVSGKESEPVGSTAEAGFYKTILQEKDRHINYLEKEIEVKNQQINSFQSQVENYQVIIQSKIPQLSEPNVSKESGIEGVEVRESEGVEAVNETANAGSKPARRNRAVLFIGTILITIVIGGLAYAYTQGYIKF